ncbi:helix-turn-helix domain-containing protein [Azospirillum sp. ST 5-10]
MRYIRKHVLGISQCELARIACTTQATVSRWERGELEPSQGDLARIRTHALTSAATWDDAWFFEPPAPEGQGAGR